MVYNMIVIADDLTGANDTGVQFVSSGQKPVVHLTTSLDHNLFENKLNIYNTDSRMLVATEAYRLSRELAGKIKDKPQRKIYKKVDSTLRGNIGYEIDG